MKRISNWKKVLIVFSIIILLVICLFGFQSTNSNSTLAKGEDNSPLPVAETQWVPICPPAYSYIIINGTPADQSLQLRTVEMLFRGYSATN